MKRKKWIIAFAIAGGLLGIAGVVLPLTGMMKIYRIPTSGMSPTVQPDDYVLAVRIFHPEKSVTRGQVVVFDAGRVHPYIPKSKFIQRVVALPGDTLSEQDGILHVNGRPLSERNGLLPQRAKSIGPPWPGVKYPLVIPPDQIFVMGDNYANSLDSRYFGPIRIDSVTHSPRAVVLPPAHSGSIR